MDTITKKRLLKVSPILCKEMADEFEEGKKRKLWRFVDGPEGFANTQHPELSIHQLKNMLNAGRFIRHLALHHPDTPMPVSISQLSGLWKQSDSMSEKVRKWKKLLKYGVRKAR